MKLYEHFDSFAGCTQCISDEKEWEGETKYCASHIFLMMWLSIACSLIWVVTVKVGVTLVLCMLVILSISKGIFWGRWTYAFIVNDKLHIHPNDPRKEIGSGTYRWAEYGDPTSEGKLPAVIRGPIFRFRNGGYLYKALFRLLKREDPNRIFWPMNGVTAKIVRPMRISHGSNIFGIKLLSEKPHRPHVVCVSLEQAMRIANRYFRLNEYLEIVDQESEMFRELRLNHDAVIAYLIYTRDRRRSPVGKHARELLNAALIDVGFTVISTTPQYREMVVKALAHLEGLVAEGAASVHEEVTT